MVPRRLMTSYMTFGPGQLSLVVLTWTFSVVLAMRRGDSVFHSTQLIGFVDPLKHGFHLVLTDEANQFLLINPFQLPAIYVTAIPLDTAHYHQVAFRQILFKDNIREDKIIRIQGLQEKSWYYICLEYETISIGSVQNQTTGTQCKIQRTLDKFGKTAESTVNDVKLLTVGDNLLEFQFFVDTSFPLQLTTYLEEDSVPLKSYIVEKPKTLTVSYRDLHPLTVYGRLCLVEQPLVQAYSAMGRNIHVKITNCYLSKDLSTRKLPDFKTSPNSAAQVARHTQTGNLGKNLASSGPTQHYCANLKSLCILLPLSIFYLLTN